MSEPKPSRGRHRSLWHFSSHEIRFALVVAVVSVWAATFALVVMRQPIVGGDFMEFYTFGRLALSGQWARQYDWPAFHALQVSTIPGSVQYDYAPSYPPLVPGLYAPVALLSFGTAFGVWITASTMLYAWLMVVAARGLRHLSRTSAVLATLMFPPFVAHQVLGQSTVWALVGFVGGWWAFTHRRPWLAGVVLSLVAIKPHLAMALAIVLLATRSWPAIAGLGLGCVVQAALALIVCGTNAVRAYVRTTMIVLGNPMLIDPSDPRHTHSLRTSLERVTSGSVATAAWLIASAAVAWLLVRIWRRSEDWALRFAALLIATLLISPHVQTYDAILLAPAVVWLTQWALQIGARHVIVALVALSVMFLTPFTRIAGVPLTIPLMIAVLWRIETHK